MFSDKNPAKALIVILRSLSDSILKNKTWLDAEKNFLSRHYNFYTDILIILARKLEKLAKFCTKFETFNFAVDFETEDIVNLDIGGSNLKKFNSLAI